MSTAATSCPSTPPASGNAYGYDSAGNRQWSVIGTTTSYYGYDADNRICWAKVTASSPGTACSPAPSGSTTYSFDGAGDLNSSASPTSSFTYNSKGQSTAITDNAVAMSSMSYADVGQSERTASTVSGSTTNYLSSPLGLDRSTTGASSTYVVRDPAGNPIGFKDGTGNHSYYLPDGEGSVVGLINGDGSTLTHKYVYDEFGRVTASTVGTAQPLGFVAGMADPTGLIKFGTRYYDPNLGRWTQQDAVGGSMSNPATMNRYAYVGDDPMNLTDRSCNQIDASPWYNWICGHWFSFLVSQCDSPFPLVERIQKVAREIWYSATPNPTSILDVFKAYYRIATGNDRPPWYIRWLSGW